jgi:hypothetical protein
MIIPLIPMNSVKIQVINTQRKEAELKLKLKLLVYSFNVRVLRGNFVLEVWGQTESF